jgi:hypothetical protein
MGDNIKMHLKETEWKVYWTDLAQNMEKWQALANTVMNLQAP